MLLSLRSASLTFLTAPPYGKANLYVVPDLTPDLITFQML